MGGGGPGAACADRPSNAWERAAAICSVLSLLGLLLGFMLLFGPPGALASAERAGRSYPVAAHAEEDRTPLAYAAPRPGPPRGPREGSYDYEAF